MATMADVAKGHMFSRNFFTSDKQKGVVSLKPQIACTPPLKNYPTNKSVARISEKMNAGSSIFFPNFTNPFYPTSSVLRYSRNLGYSALIFNTAGKKIAKRSIGNAEKAPR
jgi:hypothetical protein